MRRQRRGQRGRRTQAQVPGLACAAVGPQRAASDRGVCAEDPRAERELGAALLPVQGAAVRVQARRQDAPRLPPHNTTLVSGNIYVDSETTSTKTERMYCFRLRQALRTRSCLLRIFS